jgi:hypothetical protein
MGLLDPFLLDPQKSLSNDRHSEVYHCASKEEAEGEDFALRISSLSAIVLSPIVLSPIVLSPIALSPIVFSPVLLSISVLVLSLCPIVSVAGSTLHLLLVEEEVEVEEEVAESPGSNLVVESIHPS